MEADDVPHNDNYRGGRFYRALGENEKAEPSYDNAYVLGGGFDVER
jgi:hypothetical protein